MMTVRETIHQRRPCVGSDKHLVVGMFVVAADCTDFFGRQSQKETMKRQKPVRVNSNMGHFSSKGSERM